MKDALRAVNITHGTWGVIIVLLPFIGAVLYILSCLADWIDRKNKKK